MKPVYILKPPPSPKLFGWLPVLGSSSKSDAIVTAGILILSLAVGAAGVSIAAAQKEKINVSASGIKSVVVAPLSTSEQCIAFNTSMKLPAKVLSVKEWQSLKTPTACVKSDSMIRTYEIQRLS